ncbi:hypothetical protein [Desulfatiglans anilini]|uniref:hypothetical protein n=2 Tax=Desulfatiglans anilini TaxID=90728 RepID=UPI0012947FC9|nr:hypothetical protein [Desulfatiglans anilini]
MIGRLGVVKIASYGSGEKAVPGWEHNKIHPGMISRKNPVSNPEMRIFSPHPSGAQSQRFGVRLVPVFFNIKEIKRLRGGDLQVAAQANVQIDAEIGQKDHFRMKTK